MHKKLLWVGDPFMARKGKKKLVYNWFIIHLRYSYCVYTVMENDLNWYT